MVVETNQLCDSLTLSSSIYVTSANNSSTATVMVDDSRIRVLTLNCWQVLFLVF